MKNLPSKRGSRDSRAREHTHEVLQRRGSEAIAGQQRRSRTRILLDRRETGARVGEHIALRVSDANLDSLYVESNKALWCGTEDAPKTEEIAQFRQTIKPRELRVFFGALDPSKLSFAHRLLLKLPANAFRPSRRWA